MDLATIGIGADTSALDRAERELRGLGRTGGKVERDLGRSTKSMATGFSGVQKAVIAASSALAAIGAYRGFVDAINTTNEFNESLSNLSAITGAVGDNLEYLSDQAKDIGRTTTLSASQATTAFKLIASAKPDLLESGEALNQVTRQAVLLAEAAKIDLSQAASTVGTSLNQFGAGAESAARFVNVLAAGAKFGASEIEQTSLALKNSGAAARAAGISFEETNAGIQALAAGGIKAAEAGTGLRNVLMILEEQTDQRMKPSVVGLAEAIENLAAKEMDLTEMTEIFGRENAIAAQTLVDQSDSLADLIEKLTGTETAMEQASANTDNLRGDLKQMQSATESAQIAFVERFTPAMREATQSTTDLIKAAAEYAESDEFEDRINSIARAVRGLSDIADASATGWQGWGEDISHSLEVLDSNFSAFYSNIGMEGIETAEILSVTFGTTITNIRSLIQIMTVESASFIDRLKAESVDVSASLARGLDFYLDKVGIQIDGLREHWREAYTGPGGIQEQIDAIDEARRESIAEFLDQNDETLQALYEQVAAAKSAREEYEAFGSTQREVANNVGLLRDGFVNLNEKAAGTDRVMSAIRSSTDLLNISLDESEFRMQGVTDATGDYDDAAGDAAGSSDTLTRSVEETTEAMQAQERMLENIQRSWGEMFYEMDISANGFFDSVIDGFRRMLAEMAAADLVDLVFNGKSIGSIASGGNLAQGLGNTAGLIKNLPGMSGAGGLLESMGIGGKELAGPTQGGEGLFSNQANLTKIGMNIGAGMAGNFAGGELGEAIFGKKAESAIGATIGGVIGSFGGPLGSFIGSAIGSAIDVAAGGDGMQRMNAGFLGANTPGIDPSQTFDVDPFASGFDPIGFARRTDEDTAREVIDIFRSVDENTKELTDKLGINFSTRGATLGGFDEELTPGSAGTAFGLGGNGELTGDIGAQVNRFMSQLIDHMDGLSEELEASLRAAGSADEVFAILNAEIERQDEAANDATGATTGLTQAEERLMRERLGATSDLLGQMSDIQSMRDSMSMQMSELLGATPLFEIEQTVADQVRHIEDQRQQLIRNHRDEIRAEERLHEQRMRTAQDLDDFIFGLQTGDQSALGGQEQLSIAQQRFRDLQASAAGGDLDAAGRLSGAAQSYIDEARSMFASSSAFKDIFAEVTAGVEAVENSIGSQGEFDPSAANERLVDELRALDEQLAGIYGSINDRVIDQLSEINVSLDELSADMRDSLVGAISEFVESNPSGTEMLDALGGIEGSIDVLPGGIASAMSSILGNWAQQLHSAGASPDDIASQVPSGSIAEDALNDYLDQTGQGMVIGGQHVNYNPGDDVTQAAIQDVYAAATGAGMTSAELAAQLGFSQDDILQAAADAGLPAFATGGTVGRGGSILVGERGPEIMEVPPATRVHSNGDSMGLAATNRELVSEMRGMREQMGQLVRIAMTDGELSADQRERMTSLLERSAQNEKPRLGSARYRNADAA